LHNIILLFNCTDKSVTSVQNRLIRAREKMTAKYKDNSEVNVLRLGNIKKSPKCECKQPKNCIYF